MKCLLVDTKFKSAKAFIKHFVAIYQNYNKEQIYKVRVTQCLEILVNRNVGKEVFEQHYCDMYNDFRVVKDTRKPDDIIADIREKARR